MTEVLIRRLMSASHGLVAIDVAACPEWGYETVVYPARGAWSVARQAMMPHEIADDFGCCSACGREPVEEPMFLSPRVIFAAAGEFMLRPAATTVPVGGVIYECSQCGSADVDFGLRVRRDPVTDEWIVESVDEAGQVCLGCGSMDCRPEPRSMSAAEHKQARTELQRIAKEHAARVKNVRRVLSYVAGRVR